MSARRTHSTRPCWAPLPQSCVVCRGDSRALRGPGHGAWWAAQPCCYVPHIPCAVGARGQGQSTLKMCPGAAVQSWEDASSQSRIKRSGGTRATCALQFCPAAGASRWEFCCSGSSLSIHVFLVQHSGGGDGLQGLAKVGGEPPHGARHVRHSADPGTESQPLFSTSNLALFMPLTKGLFIVSGTEKSSKERTHCALESRPPGAFPITPHCSVCSKQRSF